MRILRLITSADPRGGGPIEGARRVGEVWAKQGHQQDLLTLDPPEEDHLFDYAGNIFNIGPPRGRGLLSKYRYSAAMVPWLKAHSAEYDAIIISGLWRYLTRGALKGLAESPTPYFVFTHGMLDPWFKEGARLKHWGKQLSWLWSEGRLLADARAVLFTSQEEKRLAEGAFWPYRVRAEVVSYGTNDVSGSSADQIKVFRTLVPALGERRFLLFLSRIHHKKGCDLLVEAFAGLARQDPELDLVIAGPDQEGLVDKLRALGTRLGVVERLHFPGMLSGEAKTGAFRAAEAFVLPSHQENFGIVVAEALACGTPVLLSNKVNIWREIVSDNAGFVAADTLQGTSELLNRFASLEENEQTRLRKNARSAFEARFRIEEAAAHLLRVLQAAQQVRGS
jgi:glycosyltransferase involved in cell wall biosynthesis